MSHMTYDIEGTQMPFQIHYKYMHALNPVRGYLAVRQLTILAV